MILREFFKTKLVEGSNLSSKSPGWQGAQNVKADEIDLKVHNRAHLIDIFDKLLHNIDAAFQSTFKTALWPAQLLQAREFLAGSSLHFFNLERPNPNFDARQPESEQNPKMIGISDEEFKKYKPKVGDIDTQINKTLDPKVEQFLNSNIGKHFGNAKFLGYSRGNEQFNGLFLLDELPITVQIDFEFGRYDPVTNAPDEWYKFSHSSAWNDVKAGIKGVMHKYIYRALAKANPTTKYIAQLGGRGKNRAMQITGPETDANFSFAVSSGEGGGLRAKYKPYIDPATGQAKFINDIPVMEPVNPGDSEYVQNLAKQFQLFFGKVPESGDLNLQQSFLGTIELMKKYLAPEAHKNAFNEFLKIVFDPGAQMINAGDPERDRTIKFAAIDQMIENLGLGNLRNTAIQMSKDYEQDYKDVEAFKAANPGVAQPRSAMRKMQATKQPVAEAEVKAQLRKNMPHLRDLKPIDFLDLLDEIHDGNGSFKLQNIPLNVKIDGFGGRFGKDAEGKPFMATSNTPPRYKAGFVQYHQEKGTTDPEILGRAEKFDQLFNEMMNAIKLVDSKLGPDFLVNKQVTCEVLFLPFASETPEGKLKFVGIQYDKFPAGVELVLVPFRVVDASTGEDIPDADTVVSSLAELGGQGSVRFLSNSLVQKDGLDVTEIINPLDNIEELKQIVSDTAGKRDRASLQLRREVEEKLMPVKIALEKAIDADPNIIGKDILGQDYEGIVINSRLGPIKVTSQQQKDIITQKNAAKAAARTEQPRTENKTAVVAVGSFAGHKGHQQLFGLTIDKATSLGGDPYLFMGSRVGKDDPIPINDKIKTWKMLYPQYANNISAVTHEGGSLMQKIKHELINPLPGKPPRYDNVVIMTGEEDNPKENEEKEKWPSILMKAVNKFQGYEHVKSSIEFTSRGTGMSFTKLRNVLKTGDEQQAFAMWNDAFNGGQDGAKPLPAEWIKHLMDVTMAGMTEPRPKPAAKKPVQQPAPQPVQQPAAVVPAPTPAPVAERLSTALIRPRPLDETQRMSAAVKLSKAWDQQQRKSAASRERAKELLSPSNNSQKEKPPSELKKENAHEIEEGDDFRAVLTFDDGKKQTIRLFNPVNPVEQVLKYMIRRKDISTLRKLVSIDGIDVGHVISQILSKRNNGVAEEWSQKYKSSINCSHPKGFSQKAHCAGKKKHNEDMTTETVCPDCGMCEAHGNSKIYDKCWTGFRKVPGKKRGEEGSCKKIGENKHVPVSEDVENIMDNLINKIIMNEAIQNNKR